MRSRVAMAVLLGIGSLFAQEIHLQRRDPDFLTRFRPEYRVPGQRQLSLVLGCGSAKSLAYIGVFEVLEEEGLEEDSITGTSGGALMGAFRAGGFSGAGLRWAFKRFDFGSAVFDSWRRTPGTSLWEDQQRQATVVRFDRRPQGWELLPGEATGRSATLALTAQLLRAEGLCGDDFSKLRVPFACIASNLTQGSAQAFTSGSLVTAVRASMSIPGAIRPVDIGGDQFVDGGASQMLPVLEASRLHPGALQLAVDISDPWDSKRAANPFSLFGRSLAQSIEVMRGLNREGADVLVDPDISDTNPFDFHRQVDLVADRGRAAMSASLPKLEERLYGEDGASPLGASRWEIQEPVVDRVAPLIAACLPADRPWLRRDAYRLLRRILAEGLAAEAWMELIQKDATVLAIHLRPNPRITQVLWQVPEDWRASAVQLARERGLEAGLPLREPQWGLFLQHLLVVASLQGRPLIDLRGCTFDAASGVLKIIVQEPPIGAVEVDERNLQPLSRMAMERLFSPLIGIPMDTRQLTRRILNADQALNLQSTTVSLESMPKEDQWRLRLGASDQTRMQVNTAVAYETTWGLHGAVDVWLRDLFVKGNDWRLHGFANRIQQGADLALRHAFLDHPETGFFLGSQIYRQHFTGDPTLGYFGITTETPPWLQVFGGSTQRATDAFAGMFQRFGQDQKGLLEFEYQRREAQLTPTSQPRLKNWQDTLVLSAEWDCLDSHTYPTEGLLLRFRAAAGRISEETAGVSPDSTDPHRSAYLLVRALSKDVIGPIGVDLAVETGLGWHTTFDRMYVLGGNASFIGTPSTRFLAPDFTIVRAGLPITLRRSFGGHVELVPRIDYGRFAQDPNLLTTGMRILGLGAVLRGSVGKFYTEAGWGQIQVHPFGPGPMRRESQLNVLLGAQPFDLWMRK